MPYEDTLPSKSEICTFWKERIYEIDPVFEWVWPSCWCCGFHYSDKYDVHKNNPAWEDILTKWEKMTLQRCHITPKSLGGSDKPENLFLLCRECHDLMPNTSIPEIFFEWIRNQDWTHRAHQKLLDAYKSYGLSESDSTEINDILNSTQFKKWAENKIGLHRPQSQYPTKLSRLTPTTLVGLAKYYKDNLYSI